MKKRRGTGLFIEIRNDSFQDIVRYVPGEPGDHVLSLVDSIRLRAEFRRTRPHSQDGTLLGVGVVSSGEGSRKAVQL